MLRIRYRPMELTAIDRNFALNLPNATIANHKSTITFDKTRIGSN